MLHPNGHCIKDWHVLGYTTQLKKSFQLILIDGRGFGDSDKPHDANYYQTQLIASDTIAVMNNLGIDRAHCFGYSMGGRNANAFIIGGAHPYAVNKLLNSYTDLLNQGLPKLVEPILAYVKKAQQNSVSAQINIVPHKNHMQLFFASTEITTLIYNFISGLNL